MNAKLTQKNESQITQIPQEEIAARAYSIYEREGRVDGRDFEHWVRAESELRTERGSTQSPREETRPLAQNQAQQPIGNGTDSQSEPSTPRAKGNKRATTPRPTAVAARN